MKTPCFQQNLLFIFVFEEKIFKKSLPQVAFFLRCYDIHIYRGVYMHSIHLGVSLQSKRLISISFMPE